MSTSFYCLYILRIFLFFIVSILKKLEQLHRKLLPLNFLNVDLMNLFIVNHESLWSIAYESFIAEGLGYIVYYH